MKNNKLETALIETGKEVEAMKQTPGLAEMENRFERFKQAVLNDDLKKQRLYGRQLAAMITKHIVEKL